MELAYASTQLIAPGDLAKVHERYSELTSPATYTPPTHKAEHACQLFDVSPLLFEKKWMGTVRIEAETNFKEEPNLQTLAGQIRETAGKLNIGVDVEVVADGTGSVMLDNLRMPMPGAQSGADAEEAQPQTPAGPLKELEMLAVWTSPQKAPVDVLKELPLPPEALLQPTIVRCSGKQEMRALIEAEIAALQKDQAVLGWKLHLLAKTWQHTFQVVSDCKAAACMCLLNAREEHLKGVLKSLANEGEFELEQGEGRLGCVESCSLCDRVTAIYANVGSSITAAAAPSAAAAAPSAAPADDQTLMEQLRSEIADIEAKIAAASGPQGKKRRKRLRQRLQKLREQFQS